MKKSSTKLSIIVPCYKVEEYLPRCIDSLLEQTLDDIEIVCVNDGSPDNCLKIMQKYQKKYGKKIVIIDKKNEGLWNARQDGIKVAIGEFIGFVDGDDYVKKDFAKKLYNSAKQNDADMAVCGFDRVDLDTGKLYSREMCNPKYNKILVKNNLGALLEINCAAWNKIYRAEILKQMPKIKNNPDIMEDLRLMELALLKTRKIVFIRKSLYIYLVRKESMISTIQKNSLPNIYTSMKEIKDIYLKNKSEYLEYIDANAFLHLGVSLMYRISANKNINFKKELSYNKSFLDQNFPRWKNNQYIKLGYIIKNKGINLKLWIVLQCYKFHLFRLFLSIYKLMINKLKVDIKW